MSAWVCSDETIAGILRAAAPGSIGYAATYYWNGDTRHINTRLEEVGQILVDENYRSVNFRYEERGDEPHVYKHSHLSQEMTAVQIIKLCNCYRYQVCEPDDYKETEAWAIVSSLRDRAIITLPGYDAAEWGI